MSALALPRQYVLPLFPRLTTLVRGAVLRLASPFSPRKARRKAAEVESADALAARLFDTYGNTILRVAYSYLHNMKDAEEVLQDTLLKYLQTRPEVDGAEHEKAWLIHVSANIAKNRINYNSLRATDELHDELVAQEQEDLAYVWDAVRELPETYREVIHLYYQEGYSTKQIAALLGRNESTVRSDLKRGREQLKAILKEAYDFAE